MIKDCRKCKHFKKKYNPFTGSEGKCEKYQVNIKGYILEDKDCFENK